MIEESKPVIDVNSETNEVVSNTFTNQDSSTSKLVEIKYSRPKFWHRVLANFIDIFVFAIIFVASFLSLRAIINNSPDYSYTFNLINTMRIDSGLYVKEGKSYLDLVSYMKSDTRFNSAAIVATSEKAIKQFFEFEKPLVSETKYETITAKYNEIRLSKVDKDGNNLFVYDGDEIVKNTTLFDNNKHQYANFYCNYIDSYLQGYFSTTPKYYDAIKKLNNYLMWVEIPVSVFSGILFAYFLPTVIFSRGRRTFGKALYHIGTIDSRFLSPTFGRNLAKWSIFLVEFVAGIASVGLVFILSFTLMAFSKKRQGFPDFMLGLQEIDMNKTKIYKNIEEISLEGVDTHKAATDFRLIQKP